MRAAAALFLCVAVLLIGGGCGLTVPQPTPLGVDQSVADAAQIVQSLKNDLEVRKAVRKEIPPATAQPVTTKAQAGTSVPEIAPESGATPETTWFEKNWGWLSWVVLLLICGAMWLVDKCSEKFGFPSKETMVRLSYYLTKCLPLTQRTIYAGVRTQYLRIKEEKRNSEQTSSAFE